MGRSQAVSKIDIVENWSKRVWEQQDVGAIDELFEDDGIAGGLGREKLAGPSDFKQFHAAMCALLSDTWLKVDDYIEQGDKLACICSFGGTCKKSGNAVEMEGGMFVEFRGDKILHAANHFEFMELYEQLDLMPKDSFATALGGERVA